MKQAFLCGLIWTCGIVQPDTLIQAPPASYTECGASSLYAACRLHGIETCLGEVRDKLGPAPATMGHSFAELTAVAESFGLNAQGIRINPDKLKNIPVPAIVHVTEGHGQSAPHFMTLLSIVDSGVWILDAPHSPRLVPWNQFNSIWTGNVLIFPARGIQVASPLLGKIGTTILGTTGVCALSLIMAGITIQISRIVSLIGAKSLLKWAWIPTVAVLLLIIVGVGYWLWPRGVLDISQPQIVLGELKPGKHETAIRIRNSGVGPLHITDIKSSCSCAVVSAPTRINPGDVAVIDLAITVTQGDRSTSLMVASNDPKGPHLINIKWTGRDKVVVSPARVVEAHAPLGSSFRGVVSLLQSELANQPQSVRQLDESGPFKVVLARSHVVKDYVSSHRETELIVECPSPEVAGIVRGIIRVVVLTQDDHTELTIPVVINFEPVADSLNQIAPVLFTDTNQESVMEQERRMTLHLSAENWKVERQPDWAYVRIVKKSQLSSSLIISVTSATQSIRKDTVVLSHPDRVSNVHIPITCWVVDPKREHAASLMSPSTWK